MELGFKLPRTPMYVDNTAAVAILQSGKVDAKTKYFAVHWHCVHELQEDKVISVEWVGTDENVADMFTKPVDSPKLSKVRAMMGLLTFVQLV
jgi:hypothetical protein